VTVIMKASTNSAQMSTGRPMILPMFMLCNPTPLSLSLSLSKFWWELGGRKEKRKITGTEMDGAWPSGQRGALASRRSQVRIPSVALD
jgi:hypothetical protein